LLGLRCESGNIIIDPVIPLSLDGLSASLDFRGYPVTFIYAVKENCFGPQAISINGKPVRFTNENNPYRKGGAVIPADLFLGLLNKAENRIEINL